MRNFLSACILSLVSGIAPMAVAQEISTYAGTGVSGYNGDNILADTAQIEAVINVHADRFGNVYYSDYSINQVRRINAAGIVTTIAGSDSAGYSGDNGPAVMARLNTPHGIAADWHGNVFIADAGNNCIRKVSASGIITTVAGNGIAGYTGDGGPATNATLSQPSGIAVDSLDNLYIADSYNNCIRKVNTIGVIFTIAGNQFGVPGYWGDGGYADTCLLNHPTDVAVDNMLNIYIADMLNARVRMIDTAGFGKIYTIGGNGDPGFYGDGGNAVIARLNLPTGVALDYLGNIYVADMGNQRIRKINQYGKISTVAGNGTPGYNGDNIPAWSASLNSPQSVGVDPSNNVYIADYGNYRVRKLDMVHAAVANEHKPTNSLEVFPNPVADGVFSVRLVSDLNETVTCTVLSLDGSLCETAVGQTNSVIHINRKLASGIYFVKARTESGSWTSKLIQL